jgi:hypothetical protein
MDDTHDEDAQAKPSFVPDEVVSAGSEKPAVADDETADDATDRADDRQGPPPDDFEVGDAITRTAIDADAE